MDAYGQPNDIQHPDNKSDVYTYTTDPPDAMAYLHAVSFLVVYDQII